VEPATLPEDGAAIPRRSFASRLSMPAMFRVFAIAIAALLALLVLYAYRQPEFLIDFVNLRLC
jgi:hypothetical protein